MSGDVNETAMYFAVGLAFLLIIISAALGIYWQSDYWIQRSYATADSLVNRVAAEEFDNFDQKVVSGSQVKAVLQRYSGKDIVLLVANASLNSDISLCDAYLVGGEGGAKYVKAAGTPPLGDNVTAENYAIPILVYSKYFNSATDGLDGSLGVERVFAGGGKDRPFRLLFGSEGLCLSKDTPSSAESNPSLRNKLLSTRIKAEKNLTYVPLDAYGTQCSEFLTKLCSPESGEKLLL